MSTVNGQWRIVLPEEAIASEKYAAEELQKYIREMAGIILPIVRETAESVKTGDTDEAAAKAIYLGCCSKAAKSICFEELGQEGFVLRTAGQELFIAGGRPRGTLYGVYTLLQDYLGCRWFTPEVCRIPGIERLELPEINRMEKPSLFYREVFYTSAFDGDWAARLKLNGQHHRVEEKHGGKIRYSKRFVHTFEKLVPPEEFGDTHPEYFSLVDGKRMPREAQLCLTNPDVFRIALERLEQWIAEEPEANIFSVSQNDYRNPCECEHCKRIDEEEGSYSGTLVRFVNRIAEAVAVKHPGIRIDTLAYMHTRKAPVLTRPAPNVIIRLCSIECCFVHPLKDERCERNQSFAMDLKHWSRLTRSLFVWDYTVNFNNYLMPFPNYGVLKENVRFFADNSVISLFEQGNYCESGTGDFTELKAYLLARLLWNPDDDTGKAADEFFEAYYKESSLYIKKYYRLINSRPKELGNYHAGIFDVPDRGFFSGEFLGRCREILRNALDSAGSDEILKRVRMVEMQIRYVELFFMKMEDSSRERIIAEFFQDVEELGISRISEWFSWQQSRDMMKIGEYGKGWDPAPIPGI